MNRITAADIINLTRRVREAQRQYFRTRAYHDLSASKALESELDRSLKAIGSVEARRCVVSADRMKPPGPSDADDVLILTLDAVVLYEPEAQLFGASP